MQLVAPTLVNRATDTIISTGLAKVAVMVWLTRWALLWPPQPDTLRKSWWAGRLGRWLFANEIVGNFGSFILIPSILHLFWRKGKVGLNFNLAAQIFTRRKVSPSGKFGKGIWEGSHLSPINYLNSFLGCAHQIRNYRRGKGFKLTEPLEIRFCSTRSAAKVRVPCRLSIAFHCWPP